MECFQIYAHEFEQAAEKGISIDGVSLADLTQADKWILSKMNRLTKDVTENIDKYELGIAVSKIYDFIWEEFCDWYIEMVKPRLTMTKTRQRQQPSGH